ncbi:MAG TPA: hypothetical protein VIK78_02725 [Ruminiclostridium sp.]
MKHNINLCEIVLREAIDENTITATYKIKGGGIVNVKSIFNSGKQFKDAILPAIVTTLKLNAKV